MLNIFRFAVITLSAFIITMLPSARDGLQPKAAALHRFDKKKLIEWGGDEPSTGSMRQNIERMEQTPFDGVVFPLRDKQGENLTWKMWGGIRLEYSGLSHMVEDLTNTRFTTLRERFVRVNVTPGTVDWFDDDAWRSVLENFAVAAKVAKNAGCKGLLFDVEQYEGKLFNFSAVPRKESREDYHKKLRQRGREWIASVSGEFPDAVILFPWAFYTFESNKQTYELLPDFLDGVFETAPPQVRLIDAGEGAYECKDRKCISWLYWKLKEDVARYSALPARYKSKVEVGFGIWIDAQWNKIGWDPNNVQKNFFSPEELKRTVTNALEVSDEYVWIYSEKLNWWTGKNVSSAYIDALKAAKAGE